MTGVSTAVNLGALTQWMAARGLDAGPLLAAERLEGGTQNVLVRLQFADRTYILRRPSLHRRDFGDKTIRREARLLAALSVTDVPHPRLVAACADPAVLGAAFYLMEPVGGFVPGAGLPPTFRSSGTMQRALGLSLCDALASLDAVDVHAVGLDDFGRPENWLERQVERWIRQLRSYRQVNGYDPAALPEPTAITGWLDKHRPRSWSAGLIHGDFGLGNVLVAHDRPVVTAIVDWELATVGDPLLDLGHLLATWPAPERRGPFAGLDAPELPDREALVERYAAATGRDTSAIVWYRVLACLRLAVILEGTNARAQAGQASTAVGERLHDLAVDLLDQARTVIGRQRHLVRRNDGLGL